VLALCAVRIAGASSLARLESDGKTVGQLVGQLRSGAAIRRASSRTRHAISLDLSLSAFIFQGAGSLAGSGGTTFFHSDVMISNYRNADQIIAIGFLRLGADNTNEPLQYFTLSALETVALDDFVAATLHTSGFGAVLVAGVDSQHNNDPDALLDGQSRIWTFQPGSSGKVSLGLPAVDLIDIVGSATSYALGLRHDATAHTNVGIVNLDAVSHTWTVHAIGLTKTAVFTVKVEAFSVTQVGIPAGTYGNLFLAMAPEAGGFEWSAYGVSIDNVTADSWESHVVNPQPF